MSRSNIFYVTEYDQSIDLSIYSEFLRPLFIIECELLMKIAWFVEFQEYVPNQKNSECFRSLHQVITVGVKSRLLRLSMSSIPEGVSVCRSYSVSDLNLGPSDRGPRDQNR